MGLNFIPINFRNGCAGDEKSKTEALLFSLLA